MVALGISPGYLLYVGLGGSPCLSPSETLSWDGRINGESPTLKSNAFREAKWPLVVLELRYPGAEPRWPGPSVCPHMAGGTSKSSQALLPPSSPGNGKKELEK